MRYEMGFGRYKKTPESEVFLRTASTTGFNAVNVMLLMQLGKSHCVYRQYLSEKVSFYHLYDNGRPTTLVLLTE